MARISEYPYLVDEEALKLAIDALQVTRRDATSHVQEALRQAVEELFERDYDTVVADESNATVLNKLAAELKVQFEQKLQTKLDDLQAHQKV